MLCTIYHLKKNSYNYMLSRNIPPPVNHILQVRTGHYQNSLFDYFQKAIKICIDVHWILKIPVKSQLDAFILL